MRRMILFVLALAAALVLMPSAAVADPNNESATFMLLIEVPNIAQAPNGDRVAVTGEGEFSVHPNSVDAAGRFTHTDSQGNTLAAGTWEATQLLSYEFYGCGSIPAIGLDIPDDLCGGALKLAVNLTPDGTTLQLKGVLTIFCVIGPQAPPTHDNPTEAGEEGINLVVPGHANFNQIISGMNVYIRMP